MPGLVWGCSAPAAVLWTMNIWAYADKRRTTCCCPLIPLAVSIDHASGKNAVKLVQKGIDVEIAALDSVAFRQRADGEMFVNFASALDLPVNSANASFFNFPKNTKLS